MTTEDYTLLAAIIPFIVALTAWLRAEVANKTANAASDAVKTPPKA
jgi:hypothetical protein